MEEEDLSSPPNAFSRRVLLTWRVVYYQDNHRFLQNSGINALELPYKLWLGLQTVKRELEEYLQNELDELEQAEVRDNAAGEVFNG